MVRSLGSAQSLLSFYPSSLKVSLYGLSCRVVRLLKFRDQRFPEARLILLKAMPKVSLASLSLTLLVKAVTGEPTMKER